MTEKKTMSREHIESLLYNAVIGLSDCKGARTDKELRDMLSEEVAINKEDVEFILNLVKGEKEE